MFVLDDQTNLEVRAHQDFIGRDGPLQVATNWHQVYKDHGFLPILCQRISFFEEPIISVPKIAPSFYSTKRSTQLSSLSGHATYSFITSGHPHPRKYLLRIRLGLRSEELRKG